MSREFYKIGGFHGHTQSWFGFDLKKLVRAIAGSGSPFRTQRGGIELVLGVLPSGATHLLMTGDQMTVWSHALGLQLLHRPMLFEEFVSLSPISFQGVDDFTRKLTKYKPKYKKGRTTDQDNSPANINYSLTEQHSGLIRGAFEHGRVFYRILRDQLDLQNLGLREIPWRKSIQIYSFVFNTWSKDARPMKERLQHPTIMDIGWTELDKSTLAPKSEIGASLHIIPISSRKLGQGRERTTFAHGETETVNSESLSARLKEVFPSNRQRAIEPIILLVFGDNETRLALQSVGVDTSDWESGIGTLLGFMGHQVESKPQRPAPPIQGHSSSHKFDRYSMGRSQERPHSSFAPVYVVDVQGMYTTLMQKPNVAASVSEMMNHMGLAGTDSTGWCAGNEAHLLVDAWRSMVEGPSIDDQREMRLSAVVGATQGLDGVEHEAGTEDPNDFQPVSTKTVDYYDDDDDY